MPGSHRLVGWPRRNRGVANGPSMGRLRRLRVTRAFVLFVASSVHAPDTAAAAEAISGLFFSHGETLEPCAYCHAYKPPGAGEPPPVAFGHATYGEHAFLGLDGPQWQELDEFHEHFHQRPFFSEIPAFLPRTNCDLDESDPLGKACSPWPLLSGFTNPTMFEIPESMELRSAGRFLVVARRMGRPGHEWFGGSDVFEPAQQNTSETQLRPTVMLLGEDMRVTAVTLLYDAVHPHGWVDVRLYTMGDEWWVHFRAPAVPLAVAAASRRRAEDPTDVPNVRAVLAKVDFTATEIPGYTSLVATFDHSSYIPLDGMVAGKNHAVFQDGEQDYLLNMLNPVKIHRLHRGNRTVEQEVAFEHPFNEKLPNVKTLHLNGGKLVYIPETHEFLGMGHHLYNNIQEEGQPAYLRRYTNLFFTLEGEPPYSLSRMSTELCFESATKAGDCEMIQFASGFSVNIAEDRVLVPYGINRLEAKLFSLPLSDALAKLRPVSEL